MLLTRDGLGDTSVWHNACIDAAVFRYLERLAAPEPDIVC